MPGIVIKSTGIYIPDTVITNKDFESFIETSDEWIVTRTGIRERHISNNEPNWSLGYKAAKDALNNANMSADMIDLILYTSVTPDYYTPSMSCIVQGKLGAKNAICLDLNCACAGFVYALDMAFRYISSGDFKNVLIISSEVLSKIIDYTDRSTCVLFGDGAASCIVSSSSNSIFSSSFGCEGDGADKIYAHSLFKDVSFLDKLSPREVSNDNNGFEYGLDSYIRMSGTDVYKFATRVMPLSIKNACDKLNISVDEIDIIVSHQANIRIIETSANKLGISIDKFYTNLDRYGNTSSASIPICLSELNLNGKIKKGDKVCVVGFGAGLTYGAVVFEW